MEILLVVSERDTKCKLFDTSILDYTIKRLQGKYHIHIFTDSEDIKKRYASKITKGKNLTDVIQHLSKQSSFVLIDKLAICNINFENLIKYHDNHEKELTVVVKNLVKNKSIPIYKLDDNKNIVEVVVKRFADTGIYVIQKDIKIGQGRTLSTIIRNKINEKQIKSFIHNGYWYSIRNIRRRSKDGTTFNFQK